MRYFYTILGLLGSFFSWFVGLFEKPVTPTPIPTPSECGPDEEYYPLYGCPTSKRIQKLNVRRKQYYFQGE